MASTNYFIDILRRILYCICLPIVMVACASSTSSKPLATPTALLLITAPPNGSAIPTPFQPLLITDTPTPYANLSGLPQYLLPSSTPDLPPTPNLATLLPNNTTAIIPTRISDSIPEPFPILSDQETVTFLLLGSDRRSGGSFRTDTIVVAALRPNSGQVTLISIPRDLWVYVPGASMMMKVNTVYQHGEIYKYSGRGPGLLKESILYNLGIRIDHVAMVDFNGFRRTIDTLGGIDVPIACGYTDWRLLDPNLDPDNEDNWALYSAGPGVIHMDGDLALWYARSRQKSSDFDRGRRQQEVLRATYKRALQIEAISKLPQLYAELNSTFVTDLGLIDLINLSPFAFQLNNADIRSYYIRPPLVWSWFTPGGAYVLSPDSQALQAMLREALSASTRTPEMKTIIIEIRNGTLNDGWDTLASERLNYAGYETRLTPAEQHDLANSLLYDLTSEQDPTRASSLLAILGLPKSALVSAPTADTEVSYVLLVGGDYNPCFNPINLAP